MTGRRNRPSEIREDLRALGEAIVIMMRVHGFSGKSTRGFGQAR
jgi:hypothetical protein